MIEAAREARSELDKAMLREGLSGQSWLTSETALGRSVSIMQEVLETRMAPAVESLLDESGRAAAKGFRSRGKRSLRAAKGFAISFDKSNPEAIRWAKEHSAKLVRGLTEGAREAVKEVLVTVFQEQLSVREAVSLLEPLIGLDARSAEAATSLRDRILNSPGKKVYAGDRPIRVPENVTAGFADKQVERYSESLLRKRAVAMARTEIVEISNEGQRQLWDQAIEEGLLDETDKREWIVTDDDRLCSICEELDGQSVGVRESFQSDEVGELSGPPAHPQCRCAQGIS